MNKLKVFIQFFLIPFCSALILAQFTRFGVGANPDSVQYIFAAKNLLEGNGLLVYSINGEIVPMTHWPPLYPIILALFGYFGVNLSTSANYLNMLLWFTTIVIFSFVINQVFSNNYLYSILATIFLGTSINLLRLYSFAWSEPIYITFMLLCIYYLYRYLSNISLFSLILSAGFASLSFLTRYAGISLIITAVFSIFLLTQKNAIYKIKSSFLFSIIAIGGNLLFFVRNYLVGNNITNRDVTLKIFNLYDLKQLIYSFSSWFIPLRLPDLIRNAISFIIILFIITAVR